MDEAKRPLYHLIVNQLKADGFEKIAHELSVATSALPPPQNDEDRLFHLVQAALMLEQEHGPHVIPGSAPAVDRVDSSSGEQSSDPSPTPVGITEQDFAEFNSGGSRGVGIANRPKHTTKFITTHKGAVRCAQFSSDGHLVATGSEDNSIKLLDVHKMVSFNDAKNKGEDPPRPAIRTFYDHTMAVNDLAFHPYQNLLVSASRDQSIKFFDTRATTKRAFRFAQDSCNIRSVAFHPTGDYLILGTDHCMIRLYDVSTRRVLTSSNPVHHHHGPINLVRYNSDGRMFASCSKDGSVRLWDGVSHKCIKYIPHAHDRAQVSSVQFSKNGKFLLTGGKDSAVRLWDIRNGNQIRLYSGHVQTKTRAHSTFCNNEDFVLSADEANAAVVAWDTRSGEAVERFTGHSNTVRWIAASSVNNHFMTCSFDSRARFWSA